jgi:rubrerythrin
MTTLLGREKDSLQAIKKLFDLEHCTIATYDLAIQALRNKDWREKLKQFRGEHTRHVKEFLDSLNQREIKTFLRPVRKQYLGKSNTEIFNRLNDKSILALMRNKEKEMLGFYQDFSIREDLTYETKRIAKKALKDEKYHTKWI